MRLSSILILNVSKCGLKVKILKRAPLRACKGERLLSVGYEKKYFSLQEAWNHSENIVSSASVQRCSR